LFPEEHTPPYIFGLASLVSCLASRAQQIQNQSSSNDPYSPWALADSFRVGLPDVTTTQYVAEDRLTYTVQLSIASNQTFNLSVSHPDGKQKFLFSSVTAQLDGTRITAHIDEKFVKAVIFEHEGVQHVMLYGKHYELRKVQAKFTTKPVDAGSLKAPMPGRIIKEFVKVGDAVKKGQPLLILEAMKMEHRINSPMDGVVKSIHFPLNSQVKQNSTLVTLED